MKKLLVTVIGAAVALGASAVDPISTQRFENASALGPTDISSLNTLSGGTAYWAAANDATNNTYEIAAAGAVNCPRQSYFPVKPENSLAIKTTFGKPLSLNAVDGGTPTNINSSIYFDSLVKFTVCEDAPDQEYADAKIVMWLQEQYDEHQEITGTNFMVRAGFLYVEGGQVKSSNVVYKCNSLASESGFDVNSWHRVTIKAIANVTKSTSTKVPGFGIYIDGDDSDSSSPIKVQSTAQKWDSTFTSAFAFSDATFDLRDGNALFPSSDQVSANPSVTAVAFDGTGSITDLIFTEEPPSFAEDSAPQIPVATVDTGSGEPTTYYTLADAVSAINVAQSATVTFALAGDLNLEEPIEFVNSTAEITLDFAGFVITNSLADAAITNSAKSLIVMNSTGKGGINCTSTGAAIYQTNAEFTDEETTVYSALSITGGCFWGEDALPIEVVDGYAGSEKIISGGYFAIPLEDYLADGKAFGDPEDGLCEVIDYVPPTYTVTVEGGEHFTVAVTTNEVAAGAAGAYVVTEGDSVAVTYTADTGYTLSKYDDSIASVDDNATIAAPTATLQTFKVIFVDGELSTTNVVDYGSSSVGVVPEFAGRTGYTAAWDNDPTAVASVTSDLTFTAVYTPVDYTITYKTAEGEAFTSWADNYAAPATFTVERDATLPTASDVALAVGVTFNGWTNAVGTTVTDTEGLTANLVVFANVTVPGPVTPTIDPAAPAAVEVTAATEQAAIDAVAVPAPAGSGIDTPEELAAYKELFVIEATNKGGDAWEVELTGIKESVKKDVSEDAVDSLVAAAQSEATTVSVDVPAGLYYKVTTYNTLGGTAVDTETGLSDGTGTTAVDKPASSTQGFIKVEMSTVPFD